MADRHGKGYKAFRRARERIKRQRPPCWLCGKPIDWDAPPAHPDSYELDHYVPISKGGENMPRGQDSLRAAHSSCNRKRGSRLPVNLRPAS
jgi:5-methylcytosine-specific restriction endonuclease McrA